MPLLKGKKNLGHNIAEMVKAGHPLKQAEAAAYRESGEDNGALVTQPNAGIPNARRRADDDGSYSVGDLWKGPGG